MSYYNITDEYNENHVYSLKELINEMIDETYTDSNYCSGDERSEKYRYFRDKIISRNGSGVYDHLVEILKFDPLGISNKDKENSSTTPKDIHCTLKIVKLFYSFEKEKDINKYYVDSDISAYSSKKTDKKAELYRIKITEILNNPSLENLKTRYSDNTTYGIILEQLDKAICSLVEEVEKRNKWWEICDYSWEAEMDNLLPYVVPIDLDVESCYQLSELCRIENYLNDIIIKRLSMIPNEIKNRHENVAETLYNIISVHIIKCQDSDLLKIKHELPESPTKDYIEDFYTILGMNLKVNDIMQIRKTIYENRLNDKLYGKIAKLILNEMPYNEKNKKYFEFAFKHYTTIIEWWNINHELKIEESISAHLFVSVIQELLHIRKNNESILNKYFGYKYFSSNAKISLSSSIQNPENVKSIAVLVILNKIENRLLVNGDRKEFLLKKFNIEKQIYKIKHIIFSYYNYSDISRVNDLIFSFVSRELISDVGAKDVLKDIWSQSKLMLDKKYDDFRLFVENEKSERALLNMCKEVIISHGRISDLSKLFAEAIVKVNNGQFYADSAIGCPVTFKYKNCIKEYTTYNMEQSCYVVFWIDMIERRFVFKDFYYTFSKDALDYIKQTGLASFIENGDIGERK